MQAFPAWRWAAAALFPALAVVCAGPDIQFLICTEALVSLPLCNTQLL